MPELRCTWVLESFGEDDELIAQRECGQQIIVTFTGSHGRPGSPTKVYPRCKRHAPPRAIEEARRLKFTIIWEDGHEPTDDTTLD